MKDRYTYPRKEKLKSRKLIAKIFKEATPISVPPLKVLYMYSAFREYGFLQTGFTVSKKNFAKAVHRNRIKRLFREAYRLEKSILKDYLENSQMQIALFFIFTGRELPTQDIIREAMKKAMHELIKKCNENAYKNS